MTEKDPGILSLFRWLIIGGFALTLIALSTQIWLVIKVSDAFAAVHFRFPKYGGLPDYTIAIRTMFGIAVIGIGTVLAGFFLGMARTRRHCETVGLTRYKFSSGWAFLSFFVPLANLYVPWASIGETRRSIYVTLQTLTTGKRWNKFGDHSAATLALALVIFVCLAGEIAYNLMSSMPTPTGLAEAYASLRLARTQIIVTLALIAVQAAAFYTYLATLEKPLQRLCDLSITGALSPEI